MPHATLGQVGEIWDSIHRIVTPSDTLNWVLPFMPAMGITRIANVTGLDQIGVPVVMVCRPNSRSVSVSQGKGRDLISAKISGLMESVESYHAERIELPLKLGSYEDLRYTHRFVDVKQLPRLADSKYTPYAQLLWIEGEDLLSGLRIWLPYELVHLDYTLPLPSGHDCFVASSNGLASGNSWDEAITHGICEVIERDATTLWHLRSESDRAATRINLETVQDVRCQQLLRKFEEAAVQVAVWETTSDTEVPSFLCRILQDKAPPRTNYRPGCGMGCHLSRGLALLRAITEAAQSRLTFISGARDDMARKGYDYFLDPAVHETWNRSMQHDGRQRDFSQAPNWICDNPSSSVQILLGQLSSVGITEVIVVDLSKPAFNVPVVRVVVPGLEGVDHSPKYRLGIRAQAILEHTSR